MIRPVVKIEITQCFMKNASKLIYEVVQVTERRILFCISNKMVNLCFLTLYQNKSS